MPYPLTIEAILNDDIWDEFSSEEYPGPYFGERMMIYKLIRLIYATETIENRQTNRNNPEFFEWLYMKRNKPIPQNTSSNDVVIKLHTYSTVTIYVRGPENQILSFFTPGEYRYTEEIMSYDIFKSYIHSNKLIRDPDNWEWKK